VKDRCWAASVVSSTATIAEPWSRASRCSNPPSAGRFATGSTSSARIGRGAIRVQDSLSRPSAPRSYLDEPVAYSRRAAETNPILAAHFDELYAALFDWRSVVEPRAPDLHATRRASASFLPLRGMFSSAAGTQPLQLRIRTSTTREAPEDWPPAEMSNRHRKSRWHNPGSVRPRPGDPAPAPEWPTPLPAPTPRMPTVPLPPRY